MKTNISKSPETTLCALGFTETEAAIYCELLRRGPATGYRLAQAVGKAPANTYQALGVLTQKGAVMVADSAAKLYRAVAPAELMAALREGFDERREEAEAALKDLHAPGPDDRIYHLKTPAQIYARARDMIGRARQIILFDLFPGPLAQLVSSLQARHSKGVTVAGLVYAKDEAICFPSVVSDSAQFASTRWPGQQLSIVADASEYLVALISPDGQHVMHGIWSFSPFMACLMHSGLACELRLSAMPVADDPLGKLSLLRSYPPGLRALAGPRPRGMREDAA
jgi:HTH-type transcriptional regulator, sugar sensing transcriptional regulator